MKKSLKLLSTLLVGVLAVGTVLTACSSKPDKGSSSPTPGSASPAVSSEPSKVPEKKVPLSLFMYGARVDGLNPSDNPIVNKVKEMTNTDLKVEMVPQADFDTKFKLMLASGSLPDIVQSSGTTDQSYEAARAGAFIDLKAYYDKSPIIQKYVTPEMMELSKDPVTGNYWRIPMAYDKAPQGSGVIARYDLVEKYNNGVWPESVEQWVDLMRVIKKANPTKSVFTNRNLGDALFSYGGTPIFDLYGANPYEFRIMNGKVVPNVVLPEYRAAVAVMRQLYTEGILDKDFASVTSDQYWAKIEKDLILLDSNATPGLLWNANHAANNIKDGRKYMFIPDLKKPPAELADMKYTYGFRNSPILTEGLFISSSSKDPDRAWKVIEAFTSDELVEDIFWGEEGKTFKVENGKKVPGLKALSEEWTRYSYYYAFVPGYEGAPDLGRAKTELALGEQYTKEVYDSIDHRMQKAMENGFGDLNGYVQPEAVALKQSESMQRINQFTVKTIMGELSIEQFDQEVAKWEKDYRGLMYDEMQKYLDTNKEMLRNMGIKRVDW
ncbi:extracellular solute-binding protein [Paenibacillus eucommiae]|uniref:Aldouronate transport system substrate-binding protein n=1 Tax=Paenibacillus eucommiae TaxID=1355755 RepID=A0ABS4IMV4_9BACL|nr:extracellular solute-binding protein [Paenibacillus eucommiae]MBP1988843.1 putative aldouronate transport system substrate-binding protein [Paenibacillus eucommiae]